MENEIAYRDFYSDQSAAEVTPTQPQLHIFQQRALNGKFLLRPLELMTHAPCEQKALQLHMGNGMKWRRGSKKKILRWSILLWQLFENWNISVFFGLTFLSTDPNSPKDRIL